MSRTGKRQKAYRRGHSAERLAAVALMLKGYRIIGRRYRTKLGEIDLIARRGDIVLMVEVKARPTLEQSICSPCAASRRRPINGLRANRITQSYRCASISSPSSPGAGQCMSPVFLPPDVGRRVRPTPRACPYA